jgi:Tol biopolymer transport system component
MKFLKPLFGLLSFTALTLSTAQANMPKSQLLLAELNTPYGLQVKIVSDSNSYNNQPSIHRDGIYFTHEVLSEGQSQTDIVYYDFASKQLTNLTNTPVSEYSPTLMPAGDSLSAIVVEENGKQKLWQYPLDEQQQPRRIFDWIEPVGYHAWGIDDDLVMFILGEPHTLQYTSVAAAKGQIVASNIGRTLIYNQSLAQFIFSYTQNEQHHLARFNPQTKQVTTLFRLPTQVQDFILKDDNTLAYAVKNRVYQRSLTGSSVISQWLDLSTYCETQITRMSYKHDKLAFVCDVSEDAFK